MTNTNYQKTASAPNRTQSNTTNPNAKHRGNKTNNPSNSSNKNNNNRTNNNRKNSTNSNSNRNNNTNTKNNNTNKNNSNRNNNPNNSTTNNRNSSNRSNNANTTRNNTRNNNTRNSNNRSNNTRTNNNRSNNNRNNSNRNSTNRSNNNNRNTNKNNNRSGGNFKKKSHIIKKNTLARSSNNNQSTRQRTIRDSDSIRLGNDDSNSSRPREEKKWSNNRPSNNKFSPQKSYHRRSEGQKNLRESALPYSSNHHHTEENSLLKIARAKANPIPKSINIMDVVTISDFAKKINLKAADLISKCLSLGMMVGINDQIDAETATLIASEYNCEVHVVSIYDETAISVDTTGVPSVSRAPVVTVMGHVDHGKTKLLDSIRNSNVTEGEHGGITQHIAAYQIVHHNSPITFIDTPGHAAFTLMRARGAQVTDIVVLVVAADDGVMPQTKEAIDHARAANVPIVVAINKIDLANTNVERVYQQLADIDLLPEEWGGKTICCKISALTGTGVPDLIEAILVVTEEMNLRSPQTCRAEGTILESRIDHGRGIICTVLVQSGTLKIGDNFLAGIYPGRVRAMVNDRNTAIATAIPSMPVEILGFSDIPNAGDPFQVAESEKEARIVGTKRQELRKINLSRSLKKHTNIDDVYETISNQSMEELKVIVKGDVNGSVEAIKTALERLEEESIRLSVIRAAAGNINENDVMLASASNANIISFNLRPSAHIQKMAEQEGVSIRRYSVIYAVVEEMQKIMRGMKDPTYEENRIGSVEVRDIFQISNVGVIAGSYVLDGVVRRNAIVAVTREKKEIFKGTIGTLKRFKNDSKEVETGYECGISIKGFNDIQKGDIFEVYELKEVTT